ncbi:stage V sporulation protein AA [Salibacterium halotolerans]|uniref:Stage V sporulation protein AA n=1 Tax=Salibacterium halotolerans TaxID=1884432 RepID=A0A1I5NUJ6_9BACI|nr:stage V sporulation protein AA [Salibacterium halotolerans]SFP25300.1 stage V sporulation protein AA [Salibacterium halotolerans]
MAHSIYLQFFSPGPVLMGDHLLVKDVARVEGKKEIVSEVLNVGVHQVTAQDKHHIVIDGLTVLARIHSVYPDLEVNILGRPQVVVDIHSGRRQTKLIPVLLVWFLLFTGAALAIMNFHEDVSMLAVHQTIYQLITGKHLEQPLLLQIPYSFGLGLGMILFFNRLFKKRLNKEPSPLEIEMFQYRQDMEEYAAETKSDRSSKWPSKS